MRGLLIALILFVLCSQGRAADTTMLARLLIPAYMAHNFAQLCSTHDSDFLSSELDGGMAAVQAYAMHVKQEVTSDISEDDAARVRVVAADTAHQIAISELHLLRAKREEADNPILKRWCDMSAKPFILEMIRNHRERHLDFDQHLRSAKQHGPSLD